VIELSKIGPKELGRAAGIFLTMLFSSLVVMFATRNMNPIIGTLVISLGVALAYLLNRLSE